MRTYIIIIALIQRIINNHEVMHEATTVSSIHLKTKTWVIRMMMLDLLEISNKNNATTRQLTNLPLLQENEIQKGRMPWLRVSPKINGSYVLVVNCPEKSQKINETP